MTRCRLSAEGKRRGFSSRGGNYDPQGEYLGPWQEYVGKDSDGRKMYRTHPEVVRVRWDGNKGTSDYARDYIEVIEDTKKTEPESAGADPDWDESLWT